MHRLTSIIAIIISLLTLGAIAVSQPVMKGTPRFDQFRGIGDSRTWEIRLYDSAIGYVESTVGDASTPNGSVLRRKVVTDYSLTGGIRIESDGTHSLNLQSEYLGEKTSITMQGRSERLELSRRGSEVAGFATRGGEKIAQTTTLSSTIRYAFDTPDIDLIEIYLATLDIKVGDSIIDTIFVPQVMSTMVLRGYVKQLASFDSKVLNRTDTAFHIHITEPQEQDWYFTINKCLSHVRWPQRNIGIYQTKVTRGKISAVATTTPATKLPAQNLKSDTAPPQTSGLNRDSLMARLQKAQKDRLGQGGEPPSLPTLAYIALLPHVIVYLLLAIVWFLVVTRGSLRQSLTWISIAVGVGLGIVALFTQIPFQRWIAMTIVYPAVTAEGGSLMLFGILPSVAGALIQGLLLFFGVGALSGRARGSARQLAILGGAVGIGFGFLEACYMQKGVGITPLVNMALIERAFLLAFHVSAGALFGAYLFKNIRLAVIAAVALICANALFRYLPMLVQTRVVELGILYFIMAIVSLGIAIWAMMTIRNLPVTKTRPRPVADIDSSSDIANEAPSE